MQTIRRNQFFTRTGQIGNAETGDDLAVKLHKVMSMKGGADALSAAMDTILKGDDEGDDTAANGLRPMGRLLTQDTKTTSGPLRPRSLLTAPPAKKAGAQ